MKSGPLLLWVSGVAAAALFVRMQFMLAGLEPGIVALQLSFTPESFRQVLAAWQAPGIAAYRSHFPTDFAFLACYGAFGYLLATHASLFTRPAAVRAIPARWLAPAAALFDASENIAHLYLVSSPADVLPSIVALSAIFSVLKFLLLALFAGAVGRALLRRRG